VAGRVLAVLLAVLVPVLVPVPVEALAAEARRYKCA
jgi:hypothetical protein